MIPVSHPIPIPSHFLCSSSFRPLRVPARARPHLFPFQSISGSLNCRLRSECRRLRCVLYSYAPTPAVPCLHPLSRWAEASVCTAAAILRCVGLGCPSQARPGQHLEISTIHAHALPRPPLRPCQWEYDNFFRQTPPISTLTSPSHSPTSYPGAALSRPA